MNESTTDVRSVPLPKGQDVGGRARAPRAEELREQGSRDGVLGKKPVQIGRIDLSNASSHKLTSITSVSPSPVVEARGGPP